MNYIISLSEIETLALGYVAASQEEWIDNVVRERCRLAIDEIVKITIQECFNTSTPVPATRDEIVALGFANGWVVLAKDKPAPTLTGVDFQGEISQED